MKKTAVILVFVLLVVLCLGLCACGNAPLPAGTENEPTVIITETTAVYTTETTTQSSVFTTTAEQAKYTSITQIPTVYRIDKTVKYPKEAASYVVDKMLLDMRNSAEDRAFVFTYHELKALSLSPSSDILKEGSRHSFLNPELVAENVYIVHVNFKFGYAGEYAELEDEKRSYEFREVEEDVPLIFMETDTEYLLWWSSAFEETHYPLEVEAFIGKEILFPAQTEAEDTGYLTIVSVPGVYRVEKGSLSATDASEILVAEMLEAMKLPSEDRRFCVLEYRNLEIKVDPPEKFLYAGHPVYATNTYTVSIRSEFRYSGTYSPIGTSTDESKWWEGLRPGGEGANLLILLETEDEYIMWWNEAYKVSFGEGLPYPAEVEGLFVY